MATIKHLFHINAPREKVYQALTTLDGLSNWWTIDTNGETNLGGIVDFGFGNQMATKMKVISLVPGQLVRWECVGGFDEWKRTIITFQLSDNENKTLVRFDHDKWKKTNDFYAACSFSWGLYLESLRHLCQTGTGQAFGTEGYRK
ncbi:MAG: SRPBCC domain-containing protein [Bacteroidia bacterium]|nr:SRPBCC domain-containing protein [Bacteroidia bacterium]